MLLSNLRGNTRRLAATALAMTLAIVFSVTSANQEAHAATLTPTVTSPGGIFAGLNAQPITLSVTTATALSAAQGALFEIEFNTFFPQSTVPDTSNSYISVASGDAMTFSADNGVSLSTSQFRTNMSNAASSGYWYMIFKPNVDVPQGTTITITFAPNSLSFPSGFGPYVNIATYESAAIDRGQAQVSLSYTISYDANGGTGTMASHGAQSSTNVSANTFTRTGYVFGSWNTAADGTGTTKYENSPNYLYSDTTLFAQWYPENHLVTFDQNDNSGITAQQWGNYDVSAPLDANTFTSSVGNFAGWATSPTGPVVYADGAPFLFRTDLTLYAVWVTSQTVSFDSNGGTGTMNDQIASAAESLTNLAFERTGYGFTGWNTVADGSGDAYENGESFSFTSSETLYAQWRLLPAAPTSTVEIQVPIGGTIDNAPVALDIDGLKDQTGYTVTVHSTPQIIDQGIIWSGRLNKAVTLPAGLESGWHRIVIDGTAADGSAFTETYYFQVSDSGTLLSTSEVAPATVSAATSGLALTGANLSGLGLATGMLALGGTLLLTLTRRKREV